MSITSEIYKRSVGGDSLDTGFELTPETEELLQAALSQGGAVSQVAAELIHPNGSFISMAKKKLGGAFSSVMNTLMIPSNGIAAMMDTDLTFKEARDRHVAPSDVLFRDLEKPETVGGKVGMFGARLITDIFLDPLTYVTFGTSSGILGISKLASIPLKASTAKKLGLATTIVKDEAGNVIEEAVRHRALSSEGLAQLNKFKSGIEETIKKDTISAFYDDTNMFGRLDRVAKNLTGKSDTEIANFMSKTSGAEFSLAEKIQAINKDPIINALTGDARNDALRAAQQRAIKESAEEQADRLVRHTLEARRTEIEDEARKVMSNIIEKNVERGGIMYDKLGNVAKDQFGRKIIKDLAKEWVDAGGIKVFGHSIITGSKIRSVARLLPGLSHIDRFTQPGRNYLGALVSNKFTLSGRVPDTLIKIQEKARARQDIRQAEIFSYIPQLYQKLGITTEEDRLISNAIAMDMPPANSPDSRLFTLWTLLRSEHGNAVAKDIAEGKYADVANMWRAAKSIQDQLTKNLTLMHESGIAAFPQKNYIPGVLNEQKKIGNPFTTFKTSKAVNAEKAELVKWRNVEDPSEVMYGVEGDLGLEKLSKAEEKQRIQTAIKNAVLKNEERRAKLTKEIEDVWGQVAEQQVKFVLKTTKNVIDKSTDDSLNARAIESLIREAVPAVDRKRVIQEYVAKYYENGSRLKADAELLSTQDITTLQETLASGDMDLDFVAQAVISQLKKVDIKTKPLSKPSAKSKDKAQESLNKLMGIVMENGIEAKKLYLKQAMEGSNIDNVITAVSDAWHKEPNGTTRLLERILGKEFELQSLINELADVRHALESELKSPGLKMVSGRWFYKDKNEKVWERVRATAQEINDNYFNGEEMFSESALKSTLVASANAVRAASSRQMINDIATRFGIPAAAAPSDFVQLGISGLQKEAIDLNKFFKLEDGKLAIKNDKGEELFFHPVVAEQVNKMLAVMADDPASHVMLQSFDNLTNLWKASVTSIFPSFHGRNAMSNVFQHMLDIGYNSLNPANHVMSKQLLSYSKKMDDLSIEIMEGNVKAAKEMMELQSKPILTDVRGHVWTAGDLIHVIKNNLVAFHPNIVGQTDVMLSSRDMVDKVMDEVFTETGKFGRAVKKFSPHSQAFKPFEYGRAVGSWIENQARVVDFIVNLKKTGDVELAVTRTKEFLFDYQNLTPFEKNVMRRLIPFYTFSRKNFELQFKTMLQTPGRTATFFHAVQTYGEVSSGAPLSDEERKLLPEWMRDSLNLVAKRDGENISLLTSIGHPIEQPFQQLHNVMGSLNPIIKAPLELNTNFSFFNGRPLSTVTNATAFSSPLVPDVIKDFIGYTKVTYNDSQGNEKVLHVSLRPERMQWFNNMPFTPRMLSTLKNLESTDMSTREKVLYTIIGFKFDDIDLEVEAKKREDELKSQLEKILDDADLGYKFDRFQLKK